MRALIIDDSSTIRKSGSMLLKQAKHEVFLAEEGFSGIAKAIEVRPDVIFIDVMMPGMNGYDVCATIKSTPCLADIPVAMLTSKDSPIDRARGKFAGADLYLVKPFDKKNLIEAFDRLVSNSIRKEV